MPSNELEKPLEEPKPLSAGLLPPRWWEQGNVAATPSRVDPTLTVSPQVAQVLNMGIDRLVDVTTRLRGDYDYTQDRLSLYRAHHDRIRTFLVNVSERLGTAEFAEVEDAIVAVRSAIEQLLNEGMP